MSTSQLLSPSTLSPSQIQLMQHTASTCENTHTEVPPTLKHKTTLCQSTVTKLNKNKVCWQRGRQGLEIANILLPIALN